MTRAIAGAAVATIALTVTATALAAGQQYNGPAGTAPNAGVEFGTRVTGGHPVTVRRFEFHNVPAQCAGYAPTAVNDLLPITMKVSATRTFSGRASLHGGKLTVKVSGRFSRTFAKATGTIRVTGSVAGCAKADTGTVKWSAPKVGHAR